MIKYGKTAAPLVLFSCRTCPLWCDWDVPRGRSTIAIKGRADSSPAQQRALVVAGIESHEHRQQDDHEDHREDADHHRQRKLRGQAVSLLLARESRLWRMSSQ